MNISFQKLDFTGNEAIAVMIGADKKLLKSAKELDKLTSGMLSKAIKNDKFSGKEGETLAILAPSGIDANRIICVGIGDKKDFSKLKAQAFGAKAAEAVKGLEEKSFKIAVDDENEENIAYVAFGARLALMANTDYKTDKDAKLKIEKITILSDKLKNIEKIYDEVGAIADGVELARKLVSMPANDLYPEKFAEISEKIAPKNLKVKVFGEKDLKKLGMEMMLSVGNGSAKETKMVVFEYVTDKNKGFDVALIGKGVCFDTGGISLKPAKGMEDMKYDMAGAGAVIGTMLSLAKRKAKANVLGIMGLVENMPSGTATRPGDVVTSMSGKTVEVINTDAEGRLVLGDLISYAEKKYKVKKIIDLATLTGAIIVALGKAYAGLFCNDDDFAEKLINAGRQSGEKVWLLPMAKEYDDMLKSDIADFKNVGAGEAGSIVAAEFLHRFVGEKVSWAHIDIAGTAFCNRTKYDPSLPKGATGFGIRLLNQFIKDNIENK